MTRIPVLAKADGSGRLHPRRGVPVTFGVPVPKSSATESEGWTLVDSDNTRRAVQTRVLDRWADGSVRWLLVDAQIDIRSEGAQLFLEPIADDAVAATAPRVTVSEVGDTVIVDTGTATFHLRSGRDFPFESVTSQQAAFGEFPCRLSVIDGDGRKCETRIRTVAVVERGPLRASVHFKGDAQRTGTEFLVVEGWIDFYAGQNASRIRVTLSNPRRAAHKGGFWDLGDTGSVFVKDVTLSLALPHALEKLRLRCSPERGAGWRAIETPFEIYQDSSGGDNWKSTAHINRDRRVPLTFRGYRLTNGSSVTNGLRATPIVAAAGGAVGICLPYFWENFPKAIGVDERSISVGLFPQQHADIFEIQGGEQKTHELFVLFGRDAITDEPLEWCRTPLVASVDPTWAFSTGAVPFLTPLEDRHASLIGAAVDGPHRFEQKREVADEYGWRHFGDIYGDHEAVRHAGPGVLVSHYNNQYDPIAGFAYQFLRTGDARWRRLMVELATHVIDIDVYHTDRDKSAYNHGLFWHTFHYGDADTSHHRSYPRIALGRTHGGGPSADHNYTTGLMHYYFMTGDEMARDTAVALGQFVIDMEDGRRTPFRWFDRGETGRATLSATDYYGPGRAAANSVSALLDAHRLTGESRFIAHAERLIRRVIHPEEDITERRLDVPEQRWFYTMFLQSLGKYLHYKAERGELDAMYAYGRASLLHYARWMAEHEYPYLDKPEKLEFKTETWAAQDVRKSDVFYFAALHAQGSERERFIERARFFYDYSMRTLISASTRALARPVAVLLTSGFMSGAVERQPDIAAPQAARSDGFGTIERFVPQRERAKRRAVLLAGLGAVAVLLVLAALILR
jgi:exo-rhamnogalacturonan lyase-like protein